MKNSMALTLVLAAGATTTVALASEQDVLPIPGAVKTVTLGNTTTDRAILPTYDNCGSFDDGAPGIVFRLVFTSQVLDDCSFTNTSLWDGATGRVITHMVAGFSKENTGDKDMVFEFYKPSEFDYAGFGRTTEANGVVPMIKPTAAMIARVRVALAEAQFPEGTSTNPASYAINFDLTGTSNLPTVPIADGETGVIVRQYFASTGATVPMTFTVTAGNNSIPGWQPAAGSITGAADYAEPGSSGIEYGRDVPPGAGTSSGVSPDYVIRGFSAIGGGTNERRQILPGNGISYGLYGDVVCPAQPNLVDLTSTEGCLDAGNETMPVQSGTVNGSVVGQEADTYQICTQATPITDAGGVFLDVDSEGSGGDLSIALYDGNGVLRAVDDGDGSGTSDQISMGIGRRAAVGDGVQYDGRDGEIAGSGNMYVIVAPAGSTFDNCFQVVAPATGSQSYTLNITSNLTSGALAASVEPIVDADLGTLVPCTAADTGTRNTTFDNQILWIKFVLPSGVSNPGGWLDIDTTRHSIDQTIGSSAGLGGADPEIILFSSTGVGIVGDDVDGPGNGFGTSAPPAFPPPTNNNYDNAAVSFGDDSTGGSFQFRNYWDPTALAQGSAQLADGRDGNLAAGTYLLALTRWSGANTPAGNNDPILALDRWHVRSRGEAPQPLAAELYYSDGACGLPSGITGWTDRVAGPVCDTLDFNGDQLFPDTQDLFDFINTAAAGGCNDLSGATNICGDLDFNNDGLPNDSLDTFMFIFMFSVGPGAPCPATLQ